MLPHQDPVLRWVETGLTRNEGRWIACFIIPPALPVTAGDIERIRVFKNQTEGWCVEQFGKGYSGHPTKYRWVLNGRIAYFRQPTDAFAFKMRWC